MSNHLRPVTEWRQPPIQSVEPQALPEFQIDPDRCKHPGYLQFGKLCMACGLHR